MTKQEVRELIEQQKSGMGLPIIEAGGTIAIRRLKSEASYLRAKTVGAYAPRPDLVDVALVMSDPERTFYIPAFDEASGGYRLAKMGETFKRSALCGLEPVDPEFASADEIDVILVPGVAFDDCGHRIGPETDIYESLLSYYHAVKIGIGIDCQFMNDLPIDESDAVMDVVITESRCLNTAQ